MRSDTGALRLAPNTPYLNLVDRLGLMQLLLVRFNLQ